MFANLLAEDASGLALLVLWPSVRSVRVIASGRNFGTPVTRLRYTENTDSWDALLRTCAFLHGLRIIVVLLLATAAVVLLRKQVPQQ